MFALMLSLLIAFSLQNPLLLPTQKHDFGAVFSNSFILAAANIYSLPDLWFVFQTLIKWLLVGLGKWLSR